MGKTENWTKPTAARTGLQHWTGPRYRESTPLFCFHSLRGWNPPAAAQPKTTYQTDLTLPSSLMLGQTDFSKRFYEILYLRSSPVPEDSWCTGYFSVVSRRFFFFKLYIISQSLPSYLRIDLLSPFAQQVMHPVSQKARRYIFQSSLFVPLICGVRFNCVIPFQGNEKTLFKDRIDTTTIKVTSLIPRLRKQDYREWNQNIRAVSQKQKLWEYTQSE